MLDSSKSLFKGYSARTVRCTVCRKPFLPHPRLKSRQKTCTEKRCQLAHRSRYRKSYRRLNPQGEVEYQDKTKLNRSPTFWKTYRLNHPKSSERNRLNSKLRKQLSKVGLQRQLDIVQVIDPPGYFDIFEAFAMSHRSLLLDYQATSAA